MSRLSEASRDKVPQEQAGYFDDLVKNYGKLPDFGPAAILAHVPKAWRLEQDLREYLRSESSLTEDVVELVILVTARELDCQFVWNAHTELARKAGIPDPLVEAIRDNKPLPAAPVASEKYLGIISYGREFFRTHRVGPGTFALVTSQLGERGAVEMMLLFGNYFMIASMIIATDSQLPHLKGGPLLPLA